MRRPVSSVTVRPAGFFAAAGAAGTAEVCGLPIAGADEFCWRNKVAPDAVRCEPHTMPRKCRHQRRNQKPSCCFPPPQNILPRNKKASRIERGVSPHSFSRRVSASTSSGRFPDFRLLSESARGGFEESLLELAAAHSKSPSPARPHSDARLPATADYSGGTVADFHGLPRKSKAACAASNFRSASASFAPAKLPEPAKLSIASVSAP